MIISSLRDEIESEDESDSYSEADESDNKSVTSEDTLKQSEHVSTEVKVRTDSISLEDLEEIINESSTTDSEIEFSDAKEISFKGLLSKDHRSDSISTLSEKETTKNREPNHWQHLYYDDTGIEVNDDLYRLKM